MLALLSFILFYTTSIRDPKKACQARLLFYPFFLIFHMIQLQNLMIYHFLSPRNVFSNFSCNEKNRMKAKENGLLSYFFTLYVTPFVSYFYATSSVNWLL